MTTRHATLALVALLSGPALADDTRIKAAEASLALELAQMRVSLTCMSILPFFDFLAESWTDVADDALATLRDLPGTEGLVATLVPLTDPEALMPPPDTPFAEIRALCQGDPHWQRHADYFLFMGLGRRLETILTE